MFRQLQISKSWSDGDFVMSLVPFESHLTHLGHIQQVDLEKEAQRAACDLVGSPSDCIAQLTAH